MDLEKNCDEEVSLIMSQPPDSTSERARAQPPRPPAPKPFLFEEPMNLQDSTSFTSSNQIISTLLDEQNPSPAIRQRDCLHRPLGLRHKIVSMPLREGRQFRCPCATSPHNQVEAPTKTDVRTATDHTSVSEEDDDLIKLADTFKKSWPRV